MKMELDELLPLTHQIRRVYSRRAAKRESIFKRLTYISQLIASNGSRTKITTLITYVERTFNETLTSHEQLMALLSEESDDYNDMWIENLRIDIDVYLSEVQEYFEIRLMDLASESGCNDKPDCDDVHHESINSDSLDKDIITTHDNKGIDNSQLLNCSNRVPIQKENICSGMKREASLSDKPDETSISSIVNNQEAEINDEPDASPDSLQQQQSKYSDNNQTQSSSPGIKITPDIGTIDAWIDDLCTEKNDTQIPEEFDPITHMSKLASIQNLPEISLPTFDGSALYWIDFIVQFRDIIHNQPYLSGTQRMIYLIQSLQGQAKQAVQGFTHDWTGYVLALKRLKDMFAQRSYIVRAYLDTILTGTRLDDSDFNGLRHLYYALNDCITADWT